MDGWFKLVQMNFVFGSRPIFRSKLVVSFWEAKLWFAAWNFTPPPEISPEKLDFRIIFFKRKFDSSEPTGAFF